MALPVAEMQEALPYVLTTVAGGIAGGATEYFAKGRIAQTQASFVQEHGEIVAGEEAKQTPRFKRFARRAGGVALVLGVGIGALNGLAWEHQDATNQTPPELGIVVDQSGATATVDGGSAASEILHIAGEFDNNDVNATAFVAARNMVRQVKISQVDDKQPWASAPLGEATQTALDQANISQEKSLARDRRSNGVLVLTNGNSIDASLNTIAKAKQNNVPVFVVNVESGQSDPATTEQLKQTAAQTGGKYWEANKKNIDQVSEVVKDTLVPQEETNNNESPWPKRIGAAVVSLGMLAYVGKRRRSMPTGVSIK